MAVTSDKGVIVMGSSGGVHAGISRPEILLIAVTSTATAATKTFKISLNQVVFGVNDGASIPQTRIMVIGISGKPGRPIFRETDSCIRVAGDDVAIDFRRTSTYRIAGS